jgi:hypothetical protein
MTEANRPPGSALTHQSGDVKNNVSMTDHPGHITLEAPNDMEGSKYFDNASSFRLLAMEPLIFSRSDTVCVHLMLVGAWSR